MPRLFRAFTRHLLPTLSTMLAAVAMPLASAAPLATPVHGARQLVVVTTPTWDTPSGRLQAYERTAHGWKAQGAAFDVALGRSGSAWGLGLHPAQGNGPQKQEGDGRSPAGVFGIGDAFGYARQADTALPYDAMQATRLQNALRLLLKR